MKTPIKDALQVTAALLMTGSAAYAMQPPTVTTSLDTQPTQVVQERTAPEKTSPIVKTVAQKPVAEAAPAKEVTWQDNPNHCNQDTQYIDANAPFNCIDKPTQAPAPQQAAAATQTAQTYPVSANAAKAYIYEHESGNDPTRMNSTGCLGLGQACPGSKLLVACPKLDYACEDQYFTNYMVSRYGSWENALAFWQRTDPRPYAGHWW